MVADFATKKQKKTIFNSFVIQTHDISWNYWIFWIGVDVQPLSPKNLNLYTNRPRIDISS